MANLSSLLQALDQRPIAYYPCYARIMGSVSGGVVLSQLLYWWDAVHGASFYKTDAELRRETGVTEWQFRQAKKRLKGLPFLSVTVTWPRRTVYTVDWTELLRAIRETEDAPPGCETLSELLGDPLRTVRRPSPNSSETLSEMERKVIHRIKH